MADGTDLYRRTLAYDYGDDERNELMREVWSPTPWMIDVNTGRCGEDLDREIRFWCHDTFGEECWPIHGRPGVWQRGSATVFGSTWYGFATEEMMHQFLARWPQETADDCPHQPPQRPERRGDR